MSGKKVLLVDDEVAFTASLGKVLSRRGFEVETASDGLTALARIAKEPFDVIVLDVKMPGMDGLQVLAEMKRLEINSRVILLTGHLPLTGEQDSDIEGVFAYLYKPIAIQKLVSAIEAAGEDLKKK